MPNISVWIKPTKLTYAPSCVVSVVVQTELVGTSSHGRERTYGLASIHVTETHRRGKYWSSPLYRMFDSPIEFLDWLESTSSAKKKTYIFTPNVISTLTLCDFWSRLELHGCTLSKEFGDADPSAPEKCTDMFGIPTSPVVNCPGVSSSGRHYHFNALVTGINAQIVKYRTNSRSFQWCANTQYTNSTDSMIAESVGIEWKNVSAANVRHDTIASSCIARSGLYCEFFRQLCQWWVDIDGGPWGSTTAAMSYQFLKKRITAKTILRHDNQRVAELEESAVFAGRRTTWYVGNIGTEEDWLEYPDSAPNRSIHGTILDTMYHSDVRSMYPYLLARMPYPVRLLTYMHEPTLSECRDALEMYGVIASVLIRSDVSEYPLRTASGISYPIGVYRTTLCGPELMSALGSGLVQHVYSAAIYVMGMPFRTACDTLLNMRSEYRESGELAWEMFVKNLSNSMSGKLVQRKYDWVADTTASPLSDWGTWTNRDNDTGEIEHYRSVAGMTWHRTLAESYIRPMASAYAYLTAYGRWYMAYIRNICPVGTVLSQDTDGIWCTSRALDSLYIHTARTCRDAGSMHIDKSSHCGRFFGPQQYWHGKAWVMSGQSHPDISAARDTVDVAIARLDPLSGSGVPDPVMSEYTITRNIGRVHIDGTIDANGWVIPPRIYHPDLTVIPQ